MSIVTIARQFRGPPNSGNGGYVCGLLGKEMDGPSTVILRAIIPLDAPLNLAREDSRVTLTNADGTLIAEAGPASALPDVPPPPSFHQAQTGSAAYEKVQSEYTFHPPCFTCTPLRADGDGLRVFAGSYGAEPGQIAAAWTPHPAFADRDGLVPAEIVWAALDCPGSFAWLDKLGRTGGLLGTMTAEILRRPVIGAPYIVTAWPLEQSGRKYSSGVALFTKNGELLARGQQIWIGRATPDA
ncbi:MAG TPA: hypothetical protein VGG10_16005 [Rhizomicrobium sp.]|jgi:hypothetical protein